MTTDQKENNTMKAKTRKKTKTTAENMRLVQAEKLLRRFGFREIRPGVWTEPNAKVVPVKKANA